MYKKERVRAALAGKEVDRVPVAAWICTSPHSTKIRSPSPRQKSISQKNMTSTISR